MQIAKNCLNVRRLISVMNSCVVMSVILHAHFRMFENLKLLGVVHGIPKHLLSTYTLNQAPGIRSKHFLTFFYLLPVVIIA